MKCYSVLIFVLLAVLVDSTWNRRSMQQQSSPPHCTQVTKVTDYQAKFKYDYPIVYVPPGQSEAYQQLFCVNPPDVNTAVTAVCDWTAPPQVQFTLGDEYMHVQRQDPTGRFPGVHIEGEEISYYSRGEIPALTLVHSVNVTPQVPHLEKRFTYLRAEYWSPMSAVHIFFDPKALILTFNVMFPFFDLPYGIVGYSVRNPHSRVWTKWRKFNRNIKSSFDNDLHI